jgi:hypothetical protein
VTAEAVDGAAVEETELAGSDRDEAGRLHDGDRSRTIAYWTFVAFVVAAVPLLMWIGSYRWFFGDEWSFLTNRSVTTDGLFRPHNFQHWVSLPVLAYRGLYSVFALREYWPYQLVLILSHLGVAVLLRVIMRRVGVRPWLATVVAASFVLLGPAEDNILWAFQITFVWALLAGLAQMILADHDGPIDRRDWIGLGIGFLGLMTSGQAPSLVIAVGVVCLLRRRWAAAVFHTVPLGIVYLLWMWLEDVSTVFRVDDRPFTPHAYYVWTKNAAVGLFDALGHFALLGVLLAAVLVVGVALAWRAEGTRQFLRRAAVPSAMVVACILSMSSAAPSRFFIGDDASTAGRYIGVMAALMLPAIAVGAEEVVRRWPKLLLPVLALFVLPIPLNAASFGEDPLLTPGYFTNERTAIAGLPQEDIMRRLPPWVEVNESIVGQPDMTVGWLLQASANGELPPPVPLDWFQRFMLPYHLGVAITSSFEPVPDGMTCATFDEPVTLDPSVGEQWYFGTDAAIAGRADDGTAATPWMSFQDETTVEIVLPDLELLVGPVTAAQEFELCR